MSHFTNWILENQFQSFVSKFRNRQQINVERRAEEDVCRVCQLVKSSKTPFPKASSSITHDPLNRVHSDICGPFTPDVSGNLYFILFIDDFSHFANMQLIKSKSQAFQAFKTFVAYATNHQQRSLRELRYDNVEEYLSTVFTYLCREKGILLHPTLPYSKPSNSVAERFNRTIVEKAQTH